MREGRGSIDSNFFKYFFFVCTTFIYNILRVCFLFPSHIILYQVSFNIITQYLANPTLYFCTRQADIFVERYNIIYDCSTGRFLFFIALTLLFSTVTFYKRIYFILLALRSPRDPCIMYCILLLRVHTNISVFQKSCHFPQPPKCLQIFK